VIFHIAREILPEIANAIDLSSSEPAQIASRPSSSLRRIEQGRGSADSCAGANHSKGFQGSFYRHWVLLET
jgi:hypothetical protein